ncbi:DUF5131 family protein [Segnochrobactrum spirostomi]|uniref:DUF5131 family protein n=1 Tax=Segnochrobactrum spirostomi TaxID=2608987 RepID=A0A6A7Y5P4_9HYPH|nr:DUF5131 family protein [Segnochrobactrum spirostomi]MQT13667.1 DUF5131 family protein [Segnochrobactrum spirostomi]
MGEHTAISWCDHTWNPWIGCTKVSPACDGCYAEALMDKRLGRVAWGAPGAGAGTRLRTSLHTWNDPFRWERAAPAGARPFVFCASLADIFDSNVPPDWRRDAFDVMRRTPRLVYLLLTKRPGNIVRLARVAGGLPPNAAIGTTVEDLPRAERNVRDLLDASEGLGTAIPMVRGYFIDALRGKIWTPWPANSVPSSNIGDRVYTGLIHNIDWVITGGETDQGDHAARPTPTRAFRALRDQCAGARVAFHHKQNGEWIERGGEFVRVGKRAAGRLLDGRIYDGRPAVCVVKDAA